MTSMLRSTAHSMRRRKRRCTGLPISAMHHACAPANRLQLPDPDARVVPGRRNETGHDVWAFTRTEESTTISRGNGAAARTASGTIAEGVQMTFDEKLTRRRMLLGAGMLA